MKIGNNRQIARYEHEIFNVVADGAISNSHIGEGRLLPVIIIDTEENEEVPDVIKAHDAIGSGDVSLIWSRPLFSKKSVVLVLEFLKPMKVKFGIEFDIDKQKILVDGIIQGRGMYLSSGNSSDKASDFSKNRILIEVPDLDFDEEWEKLLLNSLIKKYRNKGLDTNTAKNAAKSHISQMRILSRFRRDA